MQVWGIGASIPRVVRLRRIVELRGCRSKQAVPYRDSLSASGTLGSRVAGHGGGDMRRARIIGMSLVVVFAISAISAAAASAERPEFGRCLKVAPKSLSNFDSAKCAKTAGEDAGTEAEKLKKGNYEWLPGPGANSKFTLARIGASTRVLETIGGTPLICSGGTGSGQYTGPKSVGNVVLTLTGCETGSLKCNSAGQPSGTAVFGPLEGALGIVKKGETPAQDKIGLDLFSGAKEGLVVHVDCAGLSISVQGSVIVPVMANSMKLTATLKFKQAKGKQKPEQFEGQPRDVLEWNTDGGPFEQAGMGFEAAQTNEEKIEINTVL
jgi:hypothetical protein